jgi:hypothetical protein
VGGEFALWVALGGIGILAMRAARFGLNGAMACAFVRLGAVLHLIGMWVAFVIAAALMRSLPVRSA